MMKVIGNYDAHNMGTTGHPFLDQNLMDQVYEMGRQTAAAFGRPDEEISWFGPEGTCPVCHQDLLMMNGTTTVECPICGIEGVLSLEGDKVQVHFSDKQQARARGTFDGLREHTTEIQGFGAICGPKIMANKEMIDKKMENFKKFDQVINRNSSV